MGVSDERGRHEERVGERSPRAGGSGMERAPEHEGRRGEHEAAEERGVREVGSSLPPSRSPALGPSSSLGRTLGTPRDPEAKARQSGAALETDNNNNNTTYDDDNNNNNNNNSDDDTRASTPCRARSLRLRDSGGGGPHGMVQTAGAMRDLSSGREGDPFRTRTRTS